MVRSKLKTNKVDQTAQETTENAESEEKTDENADESTETPDVDRSNIPETTLSEENGEEVPPVEEKVDLDKLEMDNSIEKKEKEVLEQMQYASEPTGLDDLPPTYDECSPQTKVNTIN
jgi:molecular chaperone GrpE (heat shock protein)